MGLMLETFDAGPEAAVPAVPPGWTEGWRAGHEEGLAEGRRAAEAEGRVLGHALAERLQVAAFSFAEARALVLAALGPLFARVADSLLPALAAQALGPWLATLVVQAARDDLACPLVLGVHPSQAEAVRPWLPAGAPYRLVEDPDISPGSARLALGEGECALDLEGCLAALRDVFAALQQPQDQKARHG